MRRDEVTFSTAIEITDVSRILTSDFGSTDTPEIVTPPTVATTEAPVRLALDDNGLAVIAGRIRGTIGRRPDLPAGRRIVQGVGVTGVAAAGDGKRDEGREHGERELVEFWRAVVRSGSVDRAAKRVYRSELSELEESFRRSFGST